MVYDNISRGGSLIYFRGQSPRYVSRFQTPASRLKKQFPHPCQPCRHSREGGNPDLRLSEIFNDHRSVDFAYGYGLRQYRLRRVSYISSRAKPTLRQPIADTLKSSEKTPHIPACFAVIPAQAGIQTFDFQKYSTITAVWALPTDAVCRNIGLGRAFMFYRRSQPYFQTTFLVKSNVQK